MLNDLLQYVTIKDAADGIDAKPCTLVDEGKVQAIATAAAFLYCGMTSSPSRQVCWV